MKRQLQENRNHKSLKDYTRNTIRNLKRNLTSKRGAKRTKEHKMRKNKELIY